MRLVFCSRLGKFLMGGERGGSKRKAVTVTLNCNKVRN